MMHDEFADFVRRQPGPISIDDAAQRFIATQFITDEFRGAALLNEVKANIRKAINEDRVDGAPRLQSVRRKHPESGKERPVYVQSTMFDVDDFKQLWRRADAEERRGRDKKSRLERDFAASYPDERPLRQQLFGFDAGDAGGHAA